MLVPHFLLGLLTELGTQQSQYPWLRQSLVSAADQTAPLGRMAEAGKVAANYNRIWLERDLVPTIQQYMT